MAKISTPSTFQTGLAGPKFIGRSDADEYRNAIYSSKNLVVMPQGGVTRRPGTLYVATAGSATTRLVEFIVSNTVSYWLLFSTTDIKVYRNDDTLAATVTQYTPLTTSVGALFNPATGVANTAVSISFTSTQLEEFNYDQSRDALEIAHRDFRTKRLVRVNDTSWTLSDVDEQDGPFDALNPNPGIAVKPSAVSGSVTLKTQNKAGTDITTYWQASDVGRLIRIRHNVDEDAVPATNWGCARITVQNATAPNGHEVQAQVQESYSAATSSTQRYAYRFGSTGGGTVNKTKNFRLGSWYAGAGFPETVKFDKGRKIQTRDNRFWGSVSDSFNQFSPTIPALETNIAGPGAGAAGDNDSSSHIVSDDCAIDITLLSQQASKITFVASDQALHIGTNAGRYTAMGTNRDAPLTPNGVNIKKQSSTPCSTVRPVVFDHVFFLHANRKVLYKLEYDFRTDRYKEINLNLIAENVLDAKVKRMTTLTYPWKMIWCVLDDGKLACLTYDDEAQVVAWSKHELASGLAKDIITIPNANGEDTLYLSVLDGSTYRIEKFGKWAVSEIVPSASRWTQDYTLMDGSIAGTSGSYTTVTGLSYLAGRTVTFVDQYGNNNAGLVVSGGGVLTLPNTKENNYQIGFPMSVELIDMPWDYYANKTTVKGKKKALKDTTFDLYETLDLSVQVLGSAYQEVINFRDGGNQMQPELFSGTKSKALFQISQDNFQIRAFQVEQAPLTILCKTQEMETED